MIRRLFSKEILLFVLFIFLFILMYILSPTKFLGSGNLTTMAVQMPEFGFFSVAMMVVLITGGINLSIITTAALSGITMVTVMAKMYENGINAPTCIVIALVVGLVVALACGFVNAFFVTIVGAAPLLVTLSTTALFGGINLYVTKGHSISGMPDIYYKISEVSFIGIPVLMWIFIIIVFVTYVIFDFTPWGRKIYIIGSNPIAAQFSGINVRNSLIKVYLYSAFMSFFAMMMMTIRYNSIRSDYGSSYLLQSLTACVLGGVDIAGGYGKVLGVVIAVATLQILSSGLNIFEANPYFIDIIMGLILLAVLAMNTIIYNIREKKTLS